MDNQHQHGASYPGTVMLELGDGVGALIVHTGPDRQGEEIEIAAVSANGVRTHAEVRERHLTDRTAYCALYHGLAAGDYTVAYGAGHASTVTITGGAVTELRCGSDGGHQNLRSCTSPLDVTSPDGANPS